MNGATGEFANAATVWRFVAMLMALGSRATTTTSVNGRSGVALNRTAQTIDPYKGDPWGSFRLIQLKRRSRAKRGIVCNNRQTKSDYDSQNRPVCFVSPSETLVSAGIFATNCNHSHAKFRTGCDFADESRLRDVKNFRRVLASLSAKRN